MNLLSLTDWSKETIEHALDLAARIKKEPEAHRRTLEGRSLLMIFQRPSLRTRVSFEVAMLQLGGHAIYYDLTMSPWGMGKETPADTARTASRYVDAIMARLVNPAELREMAEHSRVPVINGLTFTEHPVQAIGDLFTIREKKGGLQGIRLAYVGDANNNVTHSLLDACALFGIDLTIGCPRDKEFQPSIEIVERAKGLLRQGHGELRLCHDAREAVRSADVVYTDTWMSYHIPHARRDERARALAPFQVNSELMSRARKEAIFMHCLPAQRDVEVTADVMDGTQSVVFDQAENRLHTEKAILITLLGSKDGRTR